MLETILKILGAIFLIKIVLLAVLDLIDEVLPRIRRIINRLRTFLGEKQNDDRESEDPPLQNSI